MQSFIQLLVENPLTVLLVGFAILCGLIALGAFTRKGTVTLMPPAYHPGGVVTGAAAPAVAGGAPTVTHDATGRQHWVLWPALLLAIAAMGIVGYMWYNKSASNAIVELARNCQKMQATGSKEYEASLGDVVSIRVPPIEFSGNAALLAKWETEARNKIQVGHPKRDVTAITAIRFLSDPKRERFTSVVVYYNGLNGEGKKVKGAEVDLHLKPNEWTAKSSQEQATLMLSSVQKKLPVDTTSQETDTGAGMTVPQNETHTLPALSPDSVREPAPEPDAPSTVPPVI